MKLKLFISIVVIVLLGGCSKDNLAVKGDDDSVEASTGLPWVELVCVVKFDDDFLSLSESDLGLGKVATKSLDFNEAADALGEVSIDRLLDRKSVV